MNDVAILSLFIVPTLFAIAFIVSRYRTATSLQRRQILFAATGALLVAGGLCCMLALK